MATMLNTLYMNKKTLNRGYIFFNDKEKAKRWEDVLIEERVGYTPFIWRIHNTTYYGFKFFRMRFQFLTLCAKFKEVMGSETEC